MRGEDLQQRTLFSYVYPEARVPKDHPCGHGCLVRASPQSEGRSGKVQNQQDPSRCPRAGKDAPEETAEIPPRRGVPPLRENPAKDAGFSPSHRANSGSFSATLQTALDTADSFMDAMNARGALDPTPGSRELWRLLIEPPLL